MREIKFRAWDKVNGTFRKQGMIAEPSISKSDISRGGFINDIFKDKGFHWMQYKNLTDRHGTEIYDSDVLADENGHHYFVDDENDWEEIKRKVARNELEVIGNIYENPSLLEEST